MMDEDRNIGGIEIKEIKDSQISIGTLTTSVQASGDVVAGDKIVQNFFTQAPPVTEKPRQLYEPEMILIPAGLFLMGTSPEAGVPPEETPQHRVELPAYHLGKYPITNGQFAAFMEDTGKVEPSLGWLGLMPTPEQENVPVRGVTWYLALEYCQWLTQKTGRNYALPSEAEWEKAARGPDGRRYPWGDTWLEERCNPEPTPTPVDRYEAQSVYGCYDLIGNTREWTCSLWGTNSRQPDPPFRYPGQAKNTLFEWAEHSPRNVLTASSQVRRVFRGGASPNLEQMRCATRRANLPATRFDLNQHGLRVVLRTGEIKYGAQTT